MIPLKLSDVRKELPFKTHNVNLWWSIGSAAKEFLIIDYDVYLPTKGMNLQRPFCWNLEQKQQLILSIVKDIYIPKFCALVDQNKAQKSYQIIDGKQRLEAIFSFLANEFPLPTGHYFKDCAPDLQGRIKRYSPVFEVAYFHKDDAIPISDDDKIAWFEQINFAGTPQDEQHLKKLKETEHGSK